MSDETFDHTSEALRDLVLETPLPGMSILGETIHVVGDPNTPTASTDGKLIRVNDGEWLLGLSPMEVAYVLLHEWLHIFCNHVERGRHLEFSDIWNLACDITVALHCKDLLKHIPPFDEESVAGGVPPQEEYRDMTEEAIYEHLVEERKKDPAAGQGGGDMPSDLQGDSDPGEFDEAIDEAMNGGTRVAETLETFHRRFTEEIKVLHKIMEASGKSLPEGLHNRLVHISKDEAPWHRILQGTVLKRLGSRYPLYAPVNRRSFMFSDPPAILCTQHDTTERHVLLAVDVSGSVHIELLSAFAANIQPIIARAAKTTLVTFDSEIRSTKVISGRKGLMSEIDLVSGSHGYTDVRPVFRLAEELEPTAFVVLTDAAVKMPTPPRPDTIWVIPPNVTKPPWGTSITLRTVW